MRMFLFLILFIFFFGGCTQDTSDRTPEKKLSQRQRDSVLSKSKLPGAKTVGKSISASDTASARVKRIDDLSK